MDKVKILLTPIDQFRYLDILSLPRITTKRKREVMVLLRGNENYQLLVTNQGRWGPR